MKNRSGFVSNSSSSSFILANKTGNTKGIMEIDISDLIDNTIKTIKELNEYYIYAHCWGEEYNTLEKMFECEKYLKEEYDKCVKKINEGYTLFVGEVGSEDGEPLPIFFYNEGFSKLNEFEVIKEGN